MSFQIRWTKSATWDSNRTATFLLEPIHFQLIHGPFLACLSVDGVLTAALWAQVYHSCTAVSSNWELMHEMLLHQLQWSNNSIGSHVTQQTYLTQVCHLDGNATWGIIFLTALFTCVNYITACETWKYLWTVSK
jgi:hypothetical protein